MASITIPNGVTEIGDGSFEGCSSLTSMTIPNNVTSIRNSTFRGCSGLTSMNIPNGVTSIGSSAFSGCSGLTSVAIPGSVTSIGESAFYDCSALTSVIIPGSVTSIEVSAFSGCDNLEEVVSFIKEPFVIDGMASTNPCFSTSTFDNATLYVPVGTIDKYNETAGWWDFSNIVEGVPNAIKEVKAEDGLKTEDEQHEYYQLDGQRMTRLQRGINIVRDKNGATKKVLMR